MLNIRGYDTTPYTNYSLEEIRVMYTQKQCDIIVTHLTNPDKKIFVYYLIYQKIRNTWLKNFTEELLENNEVNKDSTIIIILKDKPNVSLQKVVTEFYNTYKIYIQLFWIKKLQINILENDYIPKHEIIDEDEYNDIKIKYNIDNKTVLPQILKTDPVAKILGMRPGDVCKITRPSDTAGQYITYRCCK